MRRNAPPAILLALATACGAGPTDGPLTDVALDDDGSSDASTAPAGSSEASSDSEAGSGDASADDTGHTSDADATTDVTSSTATSSADTCGDGVVDAGEACDGHASACTLLDPAFTWGDATCTANCTLDTATCQTCQAPALLPCDGQSDDVFHALELGCPDLEGWTDGNGVPILGRTFASPDPDAYRVVRRFGSHDLGDQPAWAPRAGERMLLIGTGRFGLLDLLGALLELPGAASLGFGNSNPEADVEQELPDPIKIKMAKGSLTNKPFEACDGLGDCSQTLAFQWLPASMAGDIAYLDLTVVVPTGTRGYALDLALFSAHYPEYTDTTHNDMAILWSQSEAYVGNISHLIIDGVARPLSLQTAVMAGHLAHDGAYDAALLGTGYDGLLDDHGGATDWLTVHGPAVPGEQLTLALAVLDLDDDSLDSALLVDNFRWRCESCTLGAPADQGGCGLRPASR